MGDLPRSGYALWETFLDQDPHYGRPSWIRIRMENAYPLYEIFVDFSRLLPPYPHLDSDRKGADADPGSESSVQPMWIHILNL